MLPQPPTDDLADRLAALFRAVGDPTRVRLLWHLAERPRSVSELAAHLGISISAVSHQLRLLRALHVVRGERQGKSVYYRLDDAHILGLIQVGLDHIAHSRLGLEVFS